MNVTKNNFLVLHDALLKSFNARWFVVINSWCEIGVLRADGATYALLASPKPIDVFTSSALQKAYFKVCDNKLLTYCRHPYYDSLEDFAALCRLHLDDVKKSLVKDIIWQMKHSSIYTRQLGIVAAINKELSYEQFAVNFDFGLHRDA